jgi:hypothetical protein
VERNVARVDQDQSIHNTLVIRRPKLAHIHSLLRSNSGAMPIANSKYVLMVPGYADREGQTDKDGLVHEQKLEPGDYEIEIQGMQGQFLLSTTPLHIQRRLTRLPDWALFQASDSEPMPTDELPTAGSEESGEESGEEVIHNFTIGGET